MDNNLTVSIVSFYSFTQIKELETLMAKILYIGKRRRIKGTILLANEGFNGSVSGKEEDTNILVNEIVKITTAKEVNIKVNYSTTHPFQKLKVRLKKEIIAMGIKDLNIEKLKGTYIETRDWDNFVSQDKVIVIDTRNDYETSIGSFKGSISPNTETFKQFPEWVEKNKELLQGKKIAMYCTGGIRCEKSTAYLKKIGFEEVYHLRGGILQYLYDTSNNANLWQGECFVFDDRKAVI